MSSKVNETVRIWQELGSFTIASHHVTLEGRRIFPRTGNEAGNQSLAVRMEIRVFSS